MNTKKELKLPPQIGRINFEGVEITKFWVRTFDLGKDIEEAVSMFKHAPPENDRISCPIISEYRVEGFGAFVYVILAEVDRLGLVGGVGSVFYASPERLSQAYEARDKIADDVMEELRKSDKIAGMVVIEPGKEIGRPE